MSPSGRRRICASIKWRTTTRSPGLPNRTLFYDTLGKTLAQAKKKNWGVVVLYIDLDHFKTVNDTHGHAMGDVLLTQVGNRLLESVRLRDTVGRLGGDEFAVILILEDRRKASTLVRRENPQGPRGTIHTRQLRGCRHGKYRYHVVPRGCERAGAPDQICRHRHVSGEAKGARHALHVYSTNERRALEAAQPGGCIAQGTRE